MFEYGPEIVLLQPPPINDKHAPREIVFPVPPTIELAKSWTQFKPPPPTNPYHAEDVIQLQQPPATVEYLPDIELQYPPEIVV